MAYLEIFTQTLAIKAGDLDMNILVEQEIALHQHKIRKNEGSRAAVGWLPSLSRF